MANKRRNTRGRKPTSSRPLTSSPSNPSDNQANDSSNQQTANNQEDSNVALLPPMLEELDFTHVSVNDTAGIYILQ